MKFTEAKLEKAVIELFEAEGYKHLIGEQIHKEMFDVLLRDDLKQYLLFFKYRAGNYPYLPVFYSHFTGF